MEEHSARVTALRDQLIRGVLERNSPSPGSTATGRTACPAM